MKGSTAGDRKSAAKTAGSRELPSLGSGGRFRGILRLSRHERENAKTPKNASSWAFGVCLVPTAGVEPARGITLTRS